MTEHEYESGKLDDSAAKLDEGAARLDEGAAKIHEGASALHAVAAQMTSDSDAQQNAGNNPSSTGGARDAAASALRITRAQADQIRMLVGRYGASAMDRVKRHPITALSTLGVAAAFIKVELAVGLLAGVAGAAFLANQSGTQTRRALADKSRLLLSRARETWQTRRRALPEVAATATA